MLINKFLIIAGTLAIHTISNEAVLAPPRQFNRQHQSRTLEEAIKQYFEQKTNALNIRVTTRKSETWRNYIILHHLTAILRNSTKLTFQLSFENNYHENNKYLLHNLWYVDTYEALENILPYKRRHFGTNPGYYAIILMPTSQKSDQEIQKIFEKMFSLHIVDVILLVPNIHGKGYLIYSYEPVSENKCFAVEPKIINYFIAGHFNDTELFHNKLKNFYNCEIIVKPRNVAPFFSYHDTNPNNMKGVEAELLKIIAQHLGWRIKLYTKPTKSKNHAIDEPFELLKNFTVDILMGYYFYAPQRIIGFEASLSYFTTRLVVCVKHRKRAQSRMWMLEPFQLNTWLAVLGMMVAALVLLNLSRLLHYWGNWLDIFGSIFGEPRIVRANNNFVRFSIALWYGCIVFINSFYQAKLFDTYNQPPSPLPKTLRSLKENKYTFVMPRGMDLKYWLPDYDLPKNSTMYIDTSPADPIFRTLLNSTGNVATLTTVPQMQYFELSQQLGHVFDQVPEVVQIPEFCAYFRHHSFLSKPFNNVISRIRSTGLISSWLRKLTDPGARMKNQQESDVKRLDMDKFLIIFFLFACGHLLALCIFCIEMLLGRYL